MTRQMTKFILALGAAAGLLALAPAAAQASARPTVSSAHHFTHTPVRAQQAGHARPPAGTQKAAISYGETATFECQSGQVRFDFLSVPTSEFYGGYTVYYEPIVYYLATNGHYYAYTTMTGALGGYYYYVSSGQQEYQEPYFTARVPSGYIYRVYVQVWSNRPGYVTHLDPGYVYNILSGYTANCAA